MRKEKEETAKKKEQEVTDAEKKTEEDFGDETEKSVESKHEGDIGLVEEDINSHSVRIFCSLE